MEGARLRTVVAATSLFELTGDALLHADFWATANGARLVVAHVLQPGVREAGLPVRVSRAAPREVVRTQVAMLVARRAMKLTGRSRTELDVVILEGEPVDALARLARDLAADLIVVGRSTGGAVRHRLFPGLGSQLIELGPCPVLIAGPGRPGGTMIACTDFTATAEVALRWAQAQAPRTAQRLAVLHVIEASRFVARLWQPLGGTRLAGATASAVIRDASRQRLEELAITLAAEEACLLEGRARAVIPGAVLALEADLVVLGRPRRPGRRGGLVHAVLGAGRCSMLVTCGCEEPS